jgi:hypothetical protein
VAFALGALMFSRIHLQRVALCCVWILCGAVTVFGQPAGLREFIPGSVRGVEDLPAGRVRSRIENLPAGPRARSLAWLRSFHFTELDLESLQIDNAGGIFYADKFTLRVGPVAAAGEPAVAEAAVAVSPFPSALKFHSRAGAPNVLFLNFSGETVTGTVWNTSYGRTNFSAVAFSTDPDYSTFSDAEQLAIKRIWQRVAEDYAPFNIDVTTERPATFNTRTAHALITRSTDANGLGNPESAAGGVAYVNVFGGQSYASYRPAWIYYDNLAYDESYISEAASHEIGHNLGLSHDGRSGGYEYYGGHGSGDTSWGPIMGTGYDRNVSQWSKGEYYLASNSEDDLAIIAAKISYRSDDHANTSSGATPLSIIGGKNIIATTPETDAANTNTANKGVLERNTDVDVFSFATGAGFVDLTINPWIAPSGITRGGNADILVELYSTNGTRIFTNNPSGQTFARIQTNLTEGIYYLYVRNSGAGLPLISSPSGYTPYGSIGQYFITGTVATTTALLPPGATLQVTDIASPGVSTKTFTVTYTDNASVDVTSLDDDDIVVTGANGYSRAAQFVAVNVPSNGTPRVATYAITPPNGSVWMPGDAGIYSVLMQSNQVLDTEGMAVLPGTLGQFTVSVPNAIYFANMDTDPGWTFEAEWEYGVPLYDPGIGPTSGFTGAKIIAFNLSGDYSNRQTMAYATTPAINCSGSGPLTLRFRRWLGIRNADLALVQITTNGVTWADVWTNGGEVADTAWQQVQYALPAWVEGSSNVQLRWGLSSNPSQTDIGWNIDDVEILGTVSTNSQSLIVSLLAASVPEGSNAGFTVRLAMQPSTSITVIVARASGDADLSVEAGATNVFTPLNWSNAAPVLIAAASDRDQTNGGAVFEVRSESLASVTVQALESDNTPDNMLTVSVNNPSWGSATPSQSFPVDSTIAVTATASNYFRFVQWNGAVVDTNNPLTIVLSSNVTLAAVFAEIVTTNHSTPYWWLAAHGITNAFETAESLIGANGLPLWHSEVAGLDPNDPNSLLRVHMEMSAQPGATVLNWSPVAGRIYTILESSEPSTGFAPIVGGANLPASISSVTNSLNASAAKFYRLQVQKP